MRKSISKLIVAGLSLAIGLSASAAVNMPMKNSKTKASETAVGLTAKIPAVEGKKAPSMMGKTVANAVKGNALPQVSRIAPKKGVLPVLNAPLQLPAATDDLYGICIYSEEDPTGIYTLSTSEASNAISLVSYQDWTGVAGACIANGYYYVNNLETFFGFIFAADHYVVDMETWDIVEYIDDMEGDIEFSSFGFEQTYDPTTDKIYGIFYNEDGSGYIFGEQEPGTFHTTKIADYDDMWFASGVTKDGRLFAVLSDGGVYQIDKTTGISTFLCDTGIIPGYLSGGTIDPKNNVMYWAACLQEGSLMVAIDLDNGTSEVLYDFDVFAEYVGLGIPAPQAEDAAPAAVTDLVVNFEGQNRVGEISFVMPKYTFGGEELIGTYPYTVTRNGQVIKTGECFTGHPVSFVEVVPATGNYTYMVYASNEAGDGPKTKAAMWVGPDAPVAPGNVVLAYEDGAYVVTWDAVDGTVHSGFAPENVTYNVRLYYNGAMLNFADGITDTTYAFAGELPENLTLVFATVEAVTPSITSDLGVSGTIAFGAAKTPYHESFDTADSMAPYTVINANEDGTTWSWDASGMVRVGYNSAEDMDDWLITPAIRLEAGKEYAFSFSAAAGSDWYTERIEALLGTAPTAEGMTTVLVDPTLLTYSQEVYGASIVIEETGDYYFGIHGISDADMLSIYVDWIDVAAGVSTSAPDAPAIKAVADPSGALKATIDVTVPETTISGDATDIIKVEVACDGEVINVNDAVKAGETYSVEATVPADGVYKFTATAYNASGAGRVATSTIWVGVNRPGDVTNVVIEETATVGEVKATWDAPTTDIYGYPINPDLITYVVIDREGNIMADGITGCECTFQTGITDDQSFVYYGVIAETAAGMSENSVTSNMIAVGQPYDLPVIETFADGSLEYILGTSNDGYCSWSLITDADLIPDFDGTNGALVMSGQSLGATADIFTGKISLDSEKPYFALSYYNIASDDENTLTISIKDHATGETAVLKTIVLGEGTEEAWNTVMIPVDAYAGKVVDFTLTGVINSYAYIIVDLLKVYAPADYDMAAVSIKAPAMVTPGQEFGVNVLVQNVGINTIDTYTVDLYNNGELVATANGEAVASGATATVSFEVALTALADVTNVYHAVVNCANDTNVEDNTTGETSVVVEIPNYPRAEGLVATETEGGIALTWNEPDLSPENMPMQTITDDFESYTPFAYANVGEWTLVDGDEMEIGGVNGVNFPGIEVGKTLCAYFVMNTVEAGVDGNEAYNAHSGVQYMVSTFPYNIGQSEDWLITPELSGDAQTISFYAKSFSASYPETFKVLYSTTDAEIDSFIEIDEFANIAAEWTKYSIYVPAGTKFFAIEGVSYDAFMFFVDDVTYVPANGQPMELALVGYNIYRNGVKINDEPVAETSYVDAEGSANDVYNVTVVYAEGESGPSADATAAASNDPGLSGINGVAAGNAKVAVEGRTIVVTGAQGLVNIYNADGKMFYNAAADTRNAVTVVPGVYVVKAGKMVQKVIVK